MNEKSNSALIQSLYDAFGRGDISYILGQLAGDVSWTAEGPAVIAYAGKRHGEKEVLAFFGALSSTLDNMKLSINQFVAQGDWVATYGRFAARVRATGMSFDAPVGHFFQVRDGKVAVFIDMTDTAAVAAAYTSTPSAAH